MAIRNGETIFVEVKRPGSRARSLQKVRMKELMDIRIYPFVALYIDELFICLNANDATLQKSITRKSGNANVE